MQSNIQQLIQVDVILERELPFPEKWKKQLKWEGDMLMQCIEGFEKVIKERKKLIGENQEFIEILARQGYDPQTLGQAGK